MTASFDVVIVGAGLAGLRAAQVLDQHDLSVLLVEQSEVVGGRLRSHDIEGFVVDEGFQLINPAYPELRATGVLDDFDLRQFDPALTYITSERRFDLVDPRFAPRQFLAMLSRARVPYRDLVRLARVFATANLRSIPSMTRTRDCSAREGLERAGLTRATIENVLQPFLRGTLLDDELESSWHYTQLLLRSFTHGRPGTHPRGIAALPLAMLARLRTTQVHLNESVHHVGANVVTTDAGTYRSSVVIVATDASNAHQLIGTDDLAWRSQTTWWLALPRLHDSGRLRIDLDRRFLSSALDICAVAPERAPRTISLVGAPATGLHPSSALDRLVIEDVARLYEVTTSEVRVVTKSLVEHALPMLPRPLRLARSSRQGEVLVAGDYLQTPSIQGALVSGRRAARAALMQIRP